MFGELQMPKLQVWPGLQMEQVEPSWPQAFALEPGWQVPLESQQPVEQFAGVQVFVVGPQPASTTPRRTAERESAIFMIARSSRISLPLPSGGRGEGWTLSASSAPSAHERDEHRR